MEQNERNDGQQPEVENYPLDETVIQMMAEINTQIQALNQQRQGALVLFIRQNKLQGNCWTVAENGKELVKAPAPQPAPPQR
jgi:hypothetical protein